MSLGEWLNTWLTLYVDPSGLAQSTKACYHRAVASISPTLASHDMMSLTAIDIMPWLVFVSKEHPRAAQLDRAMLSKALNLAYKLGLCPGCVIDHDTLPKPPHAPKEALVLASGDAARYLAAAKSSDCYPLLALCLCGLRRGEALGARWTDIRDGCLTLARQRLRINRSYQVLPLKTAKSRRTLLLPVQLQQELAGWPRTITGWIVDTTPERLQREHKRLICACGLPDVTLHGLRHTFATLAAAQGLPMKQLQMALGHSKMQLTADLYADHLPPLSDLPALVWPGFAG